MIKYKVKGSFLSPDGKIQNIDSDYFENLDKPFLARTCAIKYFNSFKALLIEDFAIDFGESFHEKKEIEYNNEIIFLELKYGISVQFTIDDIQYYDIDYFGYLDKNIYDEIAFGLEVEFKMYKENNFTYENSRLITYCNIGEWTEGFRDTEPQTFEVLGTNLNFLDKQKPYWWETQEQKEVSLNIDQTNIGVEKGLIVGENNFYEFKPSLLYNFNTQKAGIGIKMINAKVICSFLNSNGGVLLIGINDKREIQGLDFDFSLKNKEDKFDFFRLEFDNLLSQFFDKSVHNYVKSDFNHEYDKPFFVVSVKPSDTPFFLLNNYSNTKDFFIRTTTSSIQISDSEELVKYCLAHWKNK